MEKYKKAIRRALHRFNYYKRLHLLNEAISAIDCMQGITMVAMRDDQVTCEDYTKMAQLHGAMLKKMWYI